ncbi:MAG: signal peptidase II [Pseudobdellovibrionaceae bacterium]
MTRLSRIAFPSLSIFMLMVLDQLSKWWVTERYFSEKGLDFFPWLVAFGKERAAFVSEPITSFFNLVIVWNQGVSFGMFRDHPWVGTYIITALAFAISGFFIVWMVRARSCLIGFAGTLIVAGAISNVLDRLRFGAVIDFLDFHWGDWHYPAFNLADSCIVVGVIVLVVKSLFLDRSKGDK